MEKNAPLKHEALTGKIIRCAMNVHSFLGNGFQEVIYQRALDMELADHALHVNREHEMPVFYKGREVGTRRVDFLLEGLICIELKAVTRLEPVHLAQALNYLEAFNLEIGMLINFGAPSLEFKRVNNNKFRPDK